MKKKLLCSLLPLITFSIFSQPSPTAGGTNGKGSKIEWTTHPFDYQVFIENAGQYDGKINSDEKVLFAARNGQAMAYFTKSGVIYRYDEFLDKKGRPVTSTAKKTEEKDEDEPGEDEEAKDVPHYLASNWQGSNVEVTVTKEDKLPSYFTFPATKNTPFKTYGYKKLTYHNLYPGVDAIYSFVKGKEGFKYTLIVHSGADLSKVKMAYNGEKNMHVDSKGNMEIECEWGKLTDANPISHYEENGNNVKTSYSILNNSEETFNATNLSSSKTLVIDPAIVWTTVNPIVAVNLGAFDVDYDFNGNVYVYGGTYPYQLVKMNSAGTILWTYTTSNFTYTYYGDFCVDKVSGSVYACEGFGSTTGALTDKINNGGVFVSSYLSNSSEDEEWRIKYDLCNHQIVIAGGGTSAAYQGATLDTSMTTFTYVNVLGYPSNAYQYTYHDMCGITMDPMGNDCYMAVAWTYSNSSLDNNTIMQMPLPTLAPTTYHAPDGFDFQEVASVTYPGAALANGMNCMAASPTWLYMYDGKTLKQFLPATGALNASTVIGATSFAWGGIDVDMCDNLYVGNSTNVYIYNASLTNTGTIAMPGTVYDVALGNGVLGYGATTLYVSGNGFVSRVTVNPPNPPTITKTVTPGSCTPCTASATATLNVCGVPWAGPVTYLWSNGQTTQTATNLCSGIDSVVITMGCGIRFSDTVKIPASSGSLTLSTTVFNPGCASLGSATVTASGGTNPYTYVWSPSGGSNSTATGLSAGTYTVTVTDKNGCTNSTTVIVTATTTLTVSATNTNVLCNGGTTGTATATIIGGTAPFTYSWSPGGNSNSTATGLSAGTYTVTVTDKNGCTGTATVTITQPTAITSTTSSTQASCGNNNGTATATVSGGTGAYTYSWAAGGATSSTATGLSAGTYTVYVTDNNGCTYSTTVVVGTTTSVTATISSSTNILCNGGSTGNATVSASGGTAPYTYAWTPTGGNGSTATGLLAGTYTVTVTDANGCIGTTTVIITQPTALSVTASVSTNVLCNGGSTGSASSTASGGTSPYTYAWTPSGGNSSNAAGLSAGTYTITITDANGCSATASVTITQPPPFTVSASVIANVSCNGGANGSSNATTSGGTSPYTYAWTPTGGNSSTATGLSAGTYTITITDANGCTATATIIITEPPILSTTTSSTAASCNLSNGSITATVTGGTPVYTYSWVAGGGSTSTVSGLSIGTYTVYITDANGCTFSTTATITQPSAVAVTISSSTNVSCNGGSNGTATANASGGTAPYTYAWTPSGGNSSTASGLSAGTYTITVTDASGCVITATVIITEPPMLTAAVTSIVNVSCNGGSNGTSTVSASGGTSPYTYAWTPNGGNSSTGTGLSAGTYTLTTTDANGCTATVSVVITEPPALTVATAVTENISCNGGSNGAISCTGTGGTTPYTYAWTPSGGNTSNATGLSAGTYTITITDANGCTATASAILTEPPVLSATTSFTAASCNLSNGSVTANVTGGTPVYTYSWVAGGGSTSTVSGLSIGTYTVYVTDANGCTYSTTATITQPSAVAVNISGSTNVSCNGGANGTATASASGGSGPYTYLWSPSGGNSSIGTGLSAGTYTVTVTDANGCVITASVIITQPTALSVSASVGVNVSCFGGANGSASSTPTGGTSPYNYAWTPSGGNASSASGLSAGTYTITITDANGCTATASTIITQPAAVTASIGALTNITCFGDNNGTASVTVGGGNSPYTYAWNPNGGNGASATGLTAGAYTVTVTDANGCTATVVITLTQPALLTTTLSNTNILCNGANNGSVTSTTIGGTTPYVYAWSDGKTTANHSNLSSGTYTVTITDANGCTVTGSATITEPPSLSVTASGPQSVCSGAPATLISNASGGTLPYTYSWSPGGGTTATVTTNPVVTTTYTITVTDANGCTVSTTVTVYVNAALSLSVIGDTVVCPGGNVTLKASGSGGDGIYQYLWLPSNISSQIVSFNAWQDTTITIELTDDCGSTMQTETIHITVEPLPLPVFSTDPGSGCYPLCIQFRDLSTTSFGAITSWNWNFGLASGESDTSDVKNPIHCYNDTGTFSVTLTIATAGGCSSTITKPNIIRVYPHPHADFTWTPQPVTVLSSNIQFLDKSADPYKIIQWFWNFEDGSGSSDENPIHAYGDTGIFCTHLMVMDIHGCFDSTTKCLDVEPSYTFWIPDAFTPNGDGINDVFQPKGTYIRSYEMYIFDRWGEKLYHTDDFYTGWNGTVNNAGQLCQEDTYVYIIYVFDTQGNKHTYTGKVSLIR